ncbi:hypothetical protein AaE_013844 [Aphanomyces astaci]|uniref:Uncharacterized protein n=1 Tax=Aphanomyces astaci TaxID=112090 RepID=A0A6A4ZA44_APHAT|nr:hypothetical protein AaE_013844 [Aphanomyces astaci]
MYKGSTKRERREFMDEYLAYSRRVEVLNRGMGGTMFLMPLAACIDQKIVPQITENDWRDYFLSVREVQELDLDKVAKAMAFKMDTKLRDAESRVGRLLADFYDKVEQLDVAHLQSLKATVERELTREANQAYKSDVKSFCRWLVSLMDNFMLFESQLVVMDPKPEPNRPRQYGEKPRCQLPPKKAVSGAPARTPAMAATSAPYARGCLKCARRSAATPGPAVQKPHVAAVAAQNKKTDKKDKVIGAAVAADDVVEARAHRTLDCDISGLKATTLLDSSADQSVLSPTFLSRLEETGNFTSPVRQMEKLPSSLEEASLYPEEEQACFPQVTSDWSKENDQAVVRAKLKDKIIECRAAGCGEDFATALWALLLRYEDVFRLSLGRDPPVDVAPLRVTLKAGAEPVRCKARRYSKEQWDFMDKHVEELQAAGLCYRNPWSKLCSAPLIVKKPEANDFRMTVGVRPVNAHTERIIASFGRCRCWR